MRICGAGWAAAMVEAMDQIFSLAAWIRPPMLPVVSRAKTTSTTGRWLLPGSTGDNWAAGSGLDSGSGWPRRLG